MIHQRVLDDLAEAGRQSAALHEQSRRVLVDAVLSAAAAGLSQPQIARAVGRSQPEISRAPPVPAAQRERSEGGGSVARGDDHESSDVDLLASPPAEVTLFALARLERTLSELLQETVEVVADTNLRARLHERILAEAVPP